MSDHGRLYIDGAARGNPGPAAYAVILERPGQAPVHRAAVIGMATNNVAEYTALIEGLRLAAELGIRYLDVFSDSELLVKQMQGHYRVRHPQLQRLFQTVQQLLPRFEQVHFTHVRRQLNAEADRLANAALDGQLPAEIASASTTALSSPSPSAAASTPSALLPPPPSSLSTTLHHTLEGAAVPSAEPSPVAAQTIRAILAQAAQTWATQGLTSLDVEQVWQQICAVLRQHGPAVKP
jgi:ribonuclease HI